MRKLLFLFLSGLSLLGMIHQSAPLLDSGGERLNGNVRTTILVFDAETGGDFIWTGTTDGSLPSLRIIDGYIHNIDQIIPGYVKDIGETWIEVKIDGRSATAGRLKFTPDVGGSELRREAPGVPVETSETLVDELQIGNPGDELYVASATTGFGVDAPVDRVSVDGAVSLKEGSVPTTTADFGKIYVNDTDGHLYYIDDIGTVSDLTVDANAVQSVSSSANHTGRTSHMRFIPGEATDITESATDDTIYIQYNVNVTSSGVTPCSAPPSIPLIIEGATDVCSGEPGAGYAVQPVAGASFYRWTLPSGAVASSGLGSNSINVIFSNTDGNVCAKAVNDCGESANICTSVTINRPTSPGSITGPSLVCSGSSGESFFIATVPEATNYIWTLPPGAVLASGTGSPNITVNFGSLGGDVCVQTENSCGVSTASCLPVTITDTPVTPGSISGSTSLCGGTTGVGYSISPVAEATSYTWTVPSGASVTSGAGTNSITVTYGTASGQVCVTATSICGTSDPACISVTVTNPPSAPGTIAGSDVVPPSTSGEPYSISAVSGATSYNWSVTGDATLVGSPTGTNASVNFGTSGGTTVSLCVSAENGCGTSSETCKTITIAVPSGSTTYVYTGSQQTFTVPAGVTSVNIECWGAQGANGGYSGGLGGYATGTKSVSPGNILYVNVGQRPSGSTGGWNGGGNSGGSGGGGGGASDVRLGGTALSNRFIVGAGGGGGGYPASSYTGTAGAYGGGTTGGTSASSSGGWSSGEGGTQSSGGASTGCCNAGGSGSLGTGGYGVNGGSSYPTYAAGWGGGGGGGYYGGGGGGNCGGGVGGGGGSSYIGGVSGGSTTSNSRSGNGQVIISW